METEKAEAAELLQRWRSNRQEVLDTLGAAQVKIAALTKLIDGMEDLHPELSEKHDLVPRVPESLLDVLATVDVSHYAKAAGNPRASDVVRDILREQPTRWFSSGEMVREFKTRGIEATPTAIRLALRRTADRESERRGTDKRQEFRLKSETDSDDTLGGLEP